MRSFSSVPFASSLRSLCVLPEAVVGDTDSQGVRLFVSDYLIQSANPLSAITPLYQIALSFRVRCWVS